jgi:hypothetical protein
MINVYLFSSQIYTTYIMLLQDKRHISQMTSTFYEVLSLHSPHSPQLCTVHSFLHVYRPRFLNQCKTKVIWYVRCPPYSLLHIFRHPPPPDLLKCKHILIQRLIINTPPAVCPGDLIKYKFYTRKSRGCDNLLIFLTGAEWSLVCMWKGRGGWPGGGGGVKRPANPGIPFK